MKSKEKISRLQILILSLLKNMNASSKSKGVSIYEVQDYCDLNKSYITLFKNIKKYIEYGYIAEGLQDGKCNTYYITDNGLKLLEEVK